MSYGGSTTAKRIEGFSALDDTQICYWKAADGVWLMYFPGCGVGNLSAHEVKEHEDGTITASPSIRVTGHKNGTPIIRHGHLIKGEWRDGA